MASIASANVALTAASTAQYENFQTEVRRNQRTRPVPAACSLPNLDIRLAFLGWLDSYEYPQWPFWSHIQGWFDVRNLPNVQLVHFADLKADAEGQIRSLAAFLDIEVAPDKWPDILEHCSFEYMKAQSVERGDPTMRGGGGTFYKAGTNGRWRDILSGEDIARFQAEAARHLSPQGEQVAGHGPLVLVHRVGRFCCQRHSGAGRNCSSCRTSAENIYRNATAGVRLCATGAVFGR